jgi:hypothetical protein
MSTNSNTIALTAQSVSVVRESPGVCHTQQPASGCLLYNADLLEDLVEERFEHQESRRVEKAKRGKMTRRLSRGYSERWN